MPLGSGGPVPPASGLLLLVAARVEGRRINPFDPPGRFSIALNAGTAHMGQSIAELESPAVLRHHRLEWRIERFAWVALVLIIVAALAGFLGPGPLTCRESTSDDGSLTIEYQAVEHNAAPGQLVVRARPPAGTPQLRLAFSRSFCDRVTAESLVPSPLSVEAHGDDVVYTFAVRSTADVVVKYRYEYHDFDVFEHRIALEEGTPIRFRQYVLP
jgi:hypothetical protein